MAQGFSLPVDIPWKRLCYSKDMIDEKVCDHRFPNRWKSSIAVFTYQPSEDHQTSEDTIVSYLKVVCSITGFQEDPNELGLNDGRELQYWNDATVIDVYQDTVKAYYPCKGAILEVSIKPSKSDTPVSQYPYFSDFEPKKRELYELVTETGEKMSRSLEGVAVQKGNTTSQSNEVLDVEAGFSQKVAAASVDITGSVQGQWGTKNVNQQQYNELYSTDSSKEKRETFSHTTQLTQMYHQLNSYHLGTNRALFFILPRPHVVSSPSTFVNGPRELEGIQEFFFVIVRPKTVEEICIDAYLETAHITKTKKELKADYESEAVEPPLELHMHQDAKEQDDSKNYPAQDAKNYFAPKGYEIDLDRIESGPGYYILQNSGERIDWTDVKSYTDHVTVSGHITARYDDDQNDEFLSAWLDMKVQVYIRKKGSSTKKKYEYIKMLYLTGRGVCCCPPKVIAQGRDPYDSGPSLTFEVPIGAVEEIPHPIPPEDPLRQRQRADIAGRSAAESVLTSRTQTAQQQDLVSPSFANASTSMTIQEANLLREKIGTHMVQSINSPNRYPFGRVKFVEAQFLAQSIAQMITSGSKSKHVDNQYLKDIVGLKTSIRHKIMSEKENITRRQLLLMSFQEQQDTFGLTIEETISLRRALIGLEGPVPDPKDRWRDPKRRRTLRKVPDLKGQPLESAMMEIQRAEFFTGEINYQESNIPRNTVLSQKPRAESQALSRSRINLDVASGAEVCIPRVIGGRLSQALLLLSQAGLESETIIIFARAKGQPRNTVVDISPKERSFVTPHAKVVLRISSGTIK